MSEVQANFVWYELMTTDAVAAERFYRDVVGWGAEKQPGAQPYTLLTVGGTAVAGLMPIPDEAKSMGPGWVGYIGVPDLDAGVAKLTALGGAVHRAPADIPNVGRFAVVADPQGASFVLFQPLPGMTQMPRPQGPGAPGWRELMAGDLESAFAFYSEFCGWTKTRDHEMGEMGGAYRLFAVGDEEIGGMMTKPASMPVPFWTYYFTVDSVNAAVERITSGGGRVVNGPFPVPGGMFIVQALDPQGGFFALVSTTA
jgi:predicted enzyme related to lactoylglutathione lyase